MCVAVSDAVASSKTGSACGSRATGLKHLPLPLILLSRGADQHLCNTFGEHFWARGYAVSTVGFEEAQIRAYIKHQEQLDAQGSDESGEF